MAQRKETLKEALSNGWGTKIITTATGMLLSVLVVTGFGVYERLGRVEEKQQLILERFDRFDDRINRLEKRRWGQESGVFRANHIEDDGGDESARPNS